MSTEHNLTSTHAIKLIQQFLPDEWSGVKEDDVVISKICGGFCNTVYLVQRDQNNNHSSDPTSRLIIRFYGGNIMSENDYTYKNSEAEECVISYEMSQRGLGPKVYGIFPAGRIEQFIDSHHLTPGELETDVTIIRDVAVAYAQFHATSSLPLRKPGMKVWPSNIKLLRQFELMKDDFRRCQELRDMGIDTEKISSHDLIEECMWLKKITSVIMKRLVFAHFDNNFCNILIRNDVNQKSRVVMIDYEVSNYNFRGYDIGSVFFNKMWAPDTKNMISGSSYPDEDQMRIFIQEYLRESKILLDDFDEDSYDTIDHVMMESFAGSLTYALSAVAFFLKSYKSLLKSSPDHMKLLPFTFEFYLDQKDQFLQKYPQYKLTRNS